MQLATLVQNIPHTGGDGRSITAVTYDSRAAGAGSLFVCLVGARTDGHRYAQQAYQNGCRAFLAEHPLDLPADAAQVCTPDTRAALAVPERAAYTENIYCKQRRNKKQHNAVHKNIA